MDRLKITSRNRYWFLVFIGITMLSFFFGIEIYDSFRLGMPASFTFKNP